MTPLPRVPMCQEYIPVFRFWLFQGKEAMDIYSKTLDSEVNSLCVLISVLKWLWLKQHFFKP